MVTTCHFVSRESKGYLELPEAVKKMVIPLILHCHEGVCPSGGGQYVIGCKCVGVTHFDSFVMVNMYYHNCRDPVQ